jgi:CDP-glycerol glycerophosphotransferase (TagB/SpsB family)
VKFLLWEAKLLLAWLLDHLVGINSGRIVFVTKADAPISGNLRILLDAIADEGQREVGVFKEGPIPAETVAFLSGRGVRVMQRYSLRNLAFILSSATVVLSHSGRDAYLTRRKRGRRIVNVWHGVALKKMEAVMPRRGSRLAHAYRQRFIRRNSRLYDAVIASGEWDRHNNAAAFGLPIEKVHATGLPRLDYLSPGYRWPDDLKRQKELLEAKLAGRRLILYTPTFRESGIQLRDLLPAQEVIAWEDFGRRHNAVLGLRTHPGHLHDARPIPETGHVLRLGADLFPEPAIALAVADVLITDYSSIWVDFLARDRPVIGFVPDHQRYVEQDRGFIVDLQEIFPGPLLDSWQDARTTIEALWHAPDAWDADYSERRSRARETLAPQLQHHRSSATRRCLDLVKAQSHSHFVS